MLESRLQASFLKIIEEYGLLARAVEWRGRRDCVDIVIIDQPTLWIEVKTKTGRVRKSQHREHKKMRDHGGHVFVIRTEEELHALLRRFYPGAKRRY